MLKNTTSLIKFPVLLAAVLWLPAVSGATGLTLQTGVDEQAKLPYWEVSNQHMSIRLVQRLPDQTRGYFQARGFSPADSEKVAQACVFQTVFKNLSNNTKPSPLKYDLQQWEVQYKKMNRKMKMREQWTPVWKTAGVSKAAQIAFEWSLLPTKQTYKAGDYNWGMSIFNLKPDSQFDLKLTWNQHGRDHEFLIKNIQCAADIHPEPVSEEFGG